MQKNLEATLLFVDLSKLFDSIHRGKREQIFLAYGPPKETVTAIMMLYKSAKINVRSPDGDTDFFNIVAGVLQGDALAPISVNNLPRLRNSNGDRSDERKLLYIKKKARSRRYTAETIMDADYADDIALPANTPTQAESHLHSQEQAAGGIGLHVNADKTDYMF